MSNSGRLNIFLSALSQGGRLAIFPMPEREMDHVSEAAHQCETEKASQRKEADL